MANESSPRVSELTTGRVLARNTVWNVLGAGAPLVVALFTIPVLIAGLGTDRFGLLTLAWVVIGYFGLFDLGLGRAMTKLVADRLGEGREGDIPGLVWTALVLMLVLGVVGGLLVALLTPLLVERTLEIPPELIGEGAAAFYLLSISIPIVITTTGLRGVLEAHQRFGLVNAVRLPLGVWMFLGPVLVLPFSNRLPPVIAVLVAGRAVGWVVHLLLCLRVIPGLWRGVAFRRVLVKPLLTFGGWMTVTNLVSPLMLYLDRFVIGAVLSVTAVAYYATPYEVVTRLLIFPAALAGVLFPAFASSMARDRTRSVALFERGTRYVFILLFLPALVLVTLAHEGLTLWLGAEFAVESAAVLQWLAAGVLLNGAARVPFAFVQAMGRPDLTAKLHFAEVVLYLPALWFLIASYGILGAAVAWSVRVAVDLVLLLVMSARLVPTLNRFASRSAWGVAGAVLVLGVGAQMPTAATKALFLAVVTLVFAVMVWKSDLIAGLRSVWSSER